MIYVYENRDQAREKGQRALAFVIDNYNYKKMGQELLDVLNELIEIACFTETMYVLAYVRRIKMKKMYLSTYFRRKPRIVKEFH